LLLLVGVYFYCRIDSENLRKKKILSIGNWFLEVFYGFKGKNVDIEKEKNNQYEYLKKLAFNLACINIITFMS
jgi:hypothetical protein